MFTYTIQHRYLEVTTLTSNSTYILYNIMYPYMDICTLYMNTVCDYQMKNRGAGYTLPFYLSAFILNIYVREIK